MAATEARNDRFAELDRWDDLAILAALAEGQERAAKAAKDALPAIAMAARAVAAALGAGGRLIYAGAGSSASIAVQDGSELPGTFGIERARIAFLIAGGEASLVDINGAAEDDAAAGSEALAALGDIRGDVVIAMSASGSTPYTVGAAAAAKAAGATVIGIANNAKAPLLALADCPVLLDTGPEVIAGSTRMAAGTAQKCALGLISTLANIRLGHVYGGLMVNVRADNAKLRDRAAGIVVKITKASEDAARQALAVTGGEVKPAVLICAGVGDAAAAAALLDRTQGDLRLAMDQIGRS